MAETAEQRQRRIAVIGLGAALACMVLVFVFPRVWGAAAQERSDGALARVQLAQAPSGRPPAGRAPSRPLPGAPALAAPTVGPGQEPIEPSRPDPFMPVAGRGQYSIRSFYLPTYPALPMSMVVGFPQMERAVRGPVAPEVAPAVELYMRCSAIIWDAQGGVVAILEVGDDRRGHSVRPGDPVENYIVEQITQSAVTLRDRDTDKRRTVRLESTRAAPLAAPGAAAGEPAGRAVEPVRPVAPARPVAPGRAVEPVRPAPPPPGGRTLPRLPRPPPA